ncbi:MAG: Gldg family protein [Verrucomicrobiota bacterium]
MTLSSAGDPCSHRNLHSRQRAGTRTIVLLLVGCILGIAASAFLFYSASKRSSAGVARETDGTSGRALSDSTRAVLGRLDSPLEIRFYALLDPATVPDTLTAFAGRVSQLLSAYQQSAGGKIKVISLNAQSNADANAALADGVAVFNLDKGEACYLGITLGLNGRKETLPHLSPEWEQVLEPDLTRAIIRLADATRAGTAPTAVSQVNTNAIQDVRSLIPDLAAVTVPRGKEILQDAAFKNFTAAAKEMQAQIKDAEQRLSQAQSGGTEAEQQAALKHLREVQSEQTEKLKQIAAESKAQIDTFQQLKAAPH